LSAMADEVTVAKAARRAKASVRSTRGSSSRPRLAELTQARDEAHLEFRGWEISTEGRLGPSWTSK
jgi:hypothetical protein